MNRDLVSIIIACYNAEDYIDGCLNSLMKQTYQNFEIIICDDSSTDNSLEILKRWQEKDSRIHVLYNKKNMFAAYSRNRCIESSRGQFIMIQDIDDASKEDRIEVLVNNIKEHKVDFASSAVFEFDENINKVNSIVMKKHEFPIKKNFLWNLPFNHPATMFTRECITKAGGYRVAKETRRGQDYDMFMRMYSMGFKGMNVMQPLYYFRVDSANINRRNWAARKDEIRIRYYGFKELKLMPLGLIFVFKPIVAHLVQKIKYHKLRRQ